MEPRADISLRVPVDPIINFFECPVCFEFFQEAYITKCGHSFCKACVLEWINRNHECPKCKHHLNVDETFRNYHADDVLSKFQLELIQDEKVKAQNNYYEDLLQGADANPRTPIETVFQLNMRESLLAFQQNYDELKERYDKLKNKARSESVNQNQNQPELEQLEQRFNRAVDCLVRAYDDFMKSLAPSPNLLPLRILLKVPKKSVQIDIAVPRTHNCYDLQDILKNYFNNQGDPITDFPESGCFLIDNHGILVMEEKSKPIGEYDIEQGATIFYDGDILCASDAPKECFTRNYVKGQGLKTNYYSCAQCNYNWICEACSVSCHEDHDVRIAVPDHEASWACCNCAKRGKCTLPNNRNKK